MAPANYLREDVPFVLQIIAAALALIPIAFIIYGISILARKMHTALLGCLYNRRLAARLRRRSMQAGQLDLEAAHDPDELPNHDSDTEDNAFHDMEATIYRLDFPVPPVRAQLRSWDLRQSKIGDLAYGF